MELKKTLQKIEQLPSPDFVLQKIVETASSPNSSAKDLNEIAKKDQAFASKILKLANSTYYGLPRKVSQLTEAIMILGFKTVRNMALSIFTHDNYYRFRAKNIDIKDIWKHAVSCATVGEMIAERIGYPNKEELFMCGLMHDIGKTVQAMVVPELFEQLIALARLRKVSYYQAERLIEIPTHEVFAEMLLQNWDFPEMVIAAASFHHRPKSLGTSIYSDLVYITTLSTYIAERMKFGDNGSGTHISLPLQVWHELGLTPSSFHEIVQKTQHKIDRLDDFFSI